MIPSRLLDVPADGGYESRHVLLVGSAGGHLAQLVALRPWWVSRRRSWVTFETIDACSRLIGEDVTYAYHPTTRSLFNLVRNFGLSVRVMTTKRPDLVVSTGAGVALPFFILARVLGVPSAYIEVVDRVNSRTLTGRLCYRLADVFLVQWPEQQLLYPDSLVVGALL